MNKQLRYITTLALISTWYVAHGMEREQDQQQIASRTITVIVKGAIHNLPAATLKNSKILSEVMTYLEKKHDRACVVTMSGIPKKVWEKVILPVLQDPSLIVSTDKAPGIKLHEDLITIANTAYLLDIDYLLQAATASLVYYTQQHIDLFAESPLLFSSLYGLHPDVTYTIVKKLVAPRRVSALLENPGWDQTFEKFRITVLGIAGNKLNMFVGIDEYPRCYQKIKNRRLTGEYSLEEALFIYYMKQHKSKTFLSLPYHMQNIYRFLPDQDKKILFKN